MTPLEWVEALDKRLRARCPQIQTWNRYYDGDHNLQFATEKFRMAFGGLFNEFSDNWCATVVDAVDERLAVVGFRFGDKPEADDDAWRIWQSNHMDAESKIGFNASLIDNTGYLLVWPNEKDPETPTITVESAQQVIVAYAPGSRYDRVAALKSWTDEWTGEDCATLYLPDGVYKYKRARKPDSSIVMPIGAQFEEWTKRVVTGEEWPLPNPFGVVPIVELPNRPRLLKPARSELECVIPLQDAVNKLITDMLVASEYGAFRQKWATGIEIPKDPVTGQEIEPFRVAVERFIVAPPAEQGEQPGQFGEFSQTDLSNFVGAIDMIVSHIASQSRTPPHYLSTSADRLSGESIKSAETGLVAKARDKQLYFGEACEEALRLCFQIMGDDRANYVGAETMWKDPETRSESELVDAVGKKVTLLQVPIEQAWQDVGYSPVQIAQMKAMKLTQDLFAPVAPDVAPPGAPQDQNMPPAAPPVPPPGA